MSCHTRTAPRSSSRLSDGFTLIETLVSIAILSVLFVAIAIILSQTLNNIIDSRIRTTALTLAQENIELIQNLPYTQVGTVGGIPQGPIEPEKSIPLNGQTFTITTSIFYVDDPYDGLGSSGDTVNTDYKRARIDVMWSGARPSRIPVTLMTNIANKSQESFTGGGTLQIQVYDSNGNPVQGATVLIDNAAVTPPVHVQEYTDITGSVNRPGTPSCTACYTVSVTKQGYSEDRTYTTTEVANPIKPPLSVFDGNETLSTFAIDRKSSLTLQSYNILYQPKSFVTFTLRGSKIIGYDTNDEPVYKYSMTGNTGTYIKYIDNLEWDVYDIDLSGYGNTYAGSIPIMPVTVPPNTAFTVPFIAGPQSTASLLLRVINVQGALLASASATLTSDILGYSLTKSTPATSSANGGQAFFPTLNPEWYMYRITMEGYEEATGSMYITTNDRRSVMLEPL